MFWTIPSPFEATKTRGENRMRELVGPCIGELELVRALVGNWGVRELEVDNIMFD